MSNKTCRRCVMSNKNDIFITFDDKGNCNYCTDALNYKNTIYFPNTEGELKIASLVKKLKQEGEGKIYDCMMGISGGLDSSYLAYLGHKWGLRIFAIHIDDGFDTDVSRRNINKLCNACNIDLITIKPDSEQYNDLIKAFFLAEVPNVAAPQDNILFAYLYHYAKKYHIKTFLSGGNFALESILQRCDDTNTFDLKYIKYINQRFGKKDISKLLFLSNIERVLDRYIYGIKTIRPLNYIDYNRNKALEELASFCDFEYYGAKHCENSLTKVIQLFWLVEKFGLDKRASHLSSMIISDQLTRKDALNELDKPAYNKQEIELDLTLVLSKLHISREEFDVLISRDGKSQSDYKTSHLYKFIKKRFQSLIVKFKG